MTIRFGFHLFWISMLRKRAELRAFNPADLADFDGVGCGRFAPCLAVTRCFAPALRAVRLAAGFVFDLVIWISIGCGENISPTHRSPAAAKGCRAGQIHEPRAQTTCTLTLQTSRRGHRERGAAGRTGRPRLPLAGRRRRSRYAVLRCRSRRASLVLSAACAALDQGRLAKLRVSLSQNQIRAY
jgi:hypothetical protein